ncbi:MATE family efflux transporter [candidate division KSB1 bacterium]|nr:MATE family efflux transporter [candidate division KSB1 bacterium]
MAGKSPLKTIIKTSLPAVIDLSSQTVMFTIEAIFIGRIGYAALAGQGMAIQLIISFLTILITFIIGSSLIVVRHLGANERWEANHILGQAVMLGVIISILFALIWYFGGVYLFKLIEEGADEAAQQAGISYLRIIALFAPIVITNFIAVGIIRGAGDTHLSMIVNVIVNSLNLVLAPLLIFGWFGFPRWEVEGAAIALGIAHSVGFMVTLYFLRSHKSVLFLSFKEITTPNFKTFKRLIKTGIPTTVEQLTWSLGIMIASIYAARLGAYVLTAHVIFLRIQGILSMAYTGLSMAAMTLMGKNIGASEHQLAERTARTFSFVGFFFSLVVAIIMIIFARPIFSVFTTETKVIELGIMVMIVFALVQIPKSVGGVIIGNLRGAGELSWIMWMTIIGVLVFEVGLNWVAVFVLNLSLFGLWLVHFLDESVRILTNYWRFKVGRWKSIKI